MEELLNKLIQRGWKPSGKECIECIKEDGPKVLDWKVIYTAVRKDKGVYHIHYSLRDVVSKESGLWQFVCENGMVKMKEGFYWQNIFHLDSQEYDYTDYQYWILESSLVDEDELENFLIENIKI